MVSESVYRPGSLSASIPSFGSSNYRNGTSEFRPALRCRLSEKEKRFFTRLMGPTRAEQLQRILSGKNEERRQPTDQEILQ